MPAPNCGVSSMIAAQAPSAQDCILAQSLVILDGYASADGLITKRSTSRSPRARVAGAHAIRERASERARSATHCLLAHGTAQFRGPHTAVRDPMRAKKIDFFGVCMIVN